MINHIIVWLIGLLVVITLICVAIPGLYAKKAPADWYKVTEIADRVWAISDNGFDVFYLVAGEEKALLIDSGMGIGDLKAVVGSLPKLPVEIVNTHGHFDHTYGNYFYDTSYVSEQDVSIIKQWYTASSHEWVLKNWLKGTPLPQDFSVERWRDSSVKHVTAVQDGHVFDLGERKIEVIAVPGHTAGSICLLDQHTKILFVGDVVNSGEIWMHLPESVSLSVYVESLKKLATHRGQFEKMYWGHSQAPILSPYVFLDEVIDKAEGIIQGKYQGEIRHTPAGDGCYYSFGSFRIITAVR